MSAIDILIEAGKAAAEVVKLQPAIGQKTSPEAQEALTAWSAAVDKLFEVLPSWAVLNVSYTERRLEPGSRFHDYAGTKKAQIAHWQQTALLSTIDFL